MDGHWLSISEYSNYRGVSVSSIRRYIKDGRVKSKFEEGKYKIYVSDENYTLRVNLKEKEELSMRLELHELKDRIRLLKEENNDLRMLVDIYESRNSNTNELPPELPVN
jgi:predicted site-specific integrase-resolvase